MGTASRPLSAAPSNHAVSNNAKNGYVTLAWQDSFLNETMVKFEQIKDRGGLTALSLGALANVKSFANANGDTPLGL